MKPKKVQTEKDLIAEEDGMEAVEPKRRSWPMGFGSVCGIIGLVVGRGFFPSVGLYIAFAVVGTGIAWLVQQAWVRIVRRGKK